jgi:hypothetical protein
VLVVLLIAPLIQWVIIQFEARIQRAQGLGVFQPNRNPWKLFPLVIILGLVLP